jgi:hypothetical protein
MARTEARLASSAAIVSANWGVSAPIRVLTGELARDHAPQVGGLAAIASANWAVSARSRHATWGFSRDPGAVTGGSACDAASAGPELGRDFECQAAF